MKEPFFERLTSLDYSFLVFESTKTPMHVAATAILRLGSFGNPAGGVDMAKVKAYVASRLHLTPEYRRRLAQIPVENHPVWVDDEQFDLNYHIRHSSLPRPGNRVQLQELCARLLERPLDRTRPLWEIWVVEGLEDGCFALLMKIHHCLVDGVAGVSLMAALFSPNPETEVAPEQPWTARPRPTEGALLAAEIRRRGRMSADALKRISEGLSDPRATAREVGNRLGNAWTFLRSGLRNQSVRPFGGETSSHRRVRWLQLNLAEIKEVKKHLDGTINDVVLATVTGALRKFFRRRGTGVAPGSFRVGVPVNVRAPEASSERGNHVWMWLLPLPLEYSDPCERFDILHHDAEELKKSQQATVGELVTQAFEWTSTNFLPLGIKLINRLQPFDLLVTNVPGPPLQLYMLDAEISELYPHVPLFDGQSLAIALFSYNGALLWGVNGDWDNVADIDDFIAALKKSFHELHAAALKGRGVVEHTTRRAGATLPLRRSRSRKTRLKLMQAPNLARTG